MHLFVNVTRCRLSSIKTRVMHHISYTLQFLRSDCSLKSKFTQSLSTVDKGVGEKEKDGTRLISCSVVKHSSVGGQLPAYLGWLPLVQVSADSEARKLIGCIHL